MKYTGQLLVNKIKWAIATKGNFYESALTAIIFLLILAFIKIVL